MLGPPPWDVVHCVYSLELGGQEMVILALATLADRTLFTPRVLCLSNAGSLAPRFEAAGIPVDVLGATTSDGRIRALGALHAYLRRRRPAILHTHNPMPHQLGALARIFTDVPVLVHTKHGRNLRFTRRSTWFARIAARLTDAFVPVSADSAEVARQIERMPLSRTSVIRNGVDLSRIAATECTGDGWRVLHIARLSSVKDQDTLLRAARRVADHDARFRLDIVGDGDCREALEQLLRELDLGNVVRLHGAQRDVRPYLAAADAFVLSSVSEGIALTLLEAMAAGLPVVATDVGGNREVVTAGETGYLVPAQDPVALARALITLLSDRERVHRFGAAGRRVAENEFSVNRTVAAYEALYLRLLEPYRQKLEIV